MVSSVSPGQGQLRLLAQPPSEAFVFGSVPDCAITSAGDTNNNVFKDVFFFTEENLRKVGTYFSQLLLTMKSHNRQVHRSLWQDGNSVGSCLTRSFRTPKGRHLHTSAD